MFSFTGKNRKHKRKRRKKREKCKRERGEKEARFRCEYCKFKLTTWINYRLHIDICPEKYKKIIEEKDVEKEKILMDKEKEKENNPIVISTRQAGPPGSNKPLVLNDMTIEVNPVSLMINATQMCKAAGKKWNDYFRLSSTKEYLQGLESNMVKASVGYSGTFVHRLVAVHLAQWLSPSFAVQVSLWVKSLEKHNDLLINENQRLNSINNILENKKIKETNPIILTNKPLVLNNITIEVDPVSLMINATQMCKASGKKWNKYFKLDCTKHYLQALESVNLIRATELIKVTQGGNSTWVHRLVAVHLAQWLSSSFAVQVSLWVKSLEDNDLLINENKRLNSINNKLEKENKKITETAPVILSTKRAGPMGLNKPLVLNNITIEVDRFSGAEGDPVSLMINATQMCKAAGKLFADYQRLNGTKEYLQVLESNIGIPILELIKVDVGGNHSGTWVHRLVAVHLAQWLSPSFAVQVSLWVNELMITGKVEIGNELSNEAIDNKWRLKLMEENNRCKDLELRINLIEEDKIKKEEYEKKKIIDDLNTTISVFSTETKSNLNFHEEKEVIYLGYIGNFLFKYGQSSNFKDRLGTHEKSTTYEKFEIVKVFACKNPVVSERRVREWVRKIKLEYEYKPEGESAHRQREIIKIESKEMLERVCKTMHKYSNLNINKIPGAEVEIKRIEANKEVDIKKIEAEIDIKKIEAEIDIKKIEAEVEIKRIDLLAGGKITFDQYIELKKLK